MIRTGTLYRERVSTGRYRKGVGLCKDWKERWVAAIMVNGVRYKFRSTNYNNAYWWLVCQSEKFSDLEDIKDFNKKFKYEQTILSYLQRRNITCAFTSFISLSEKRKMLEFNKDGLFILLREFLHEYLGIRQILGDFKIKMKTDYKQIISNMENALLVEDECIRYFLRKKDNYDLLSKADKMILHVEGTDMDVKAFIENHVKYRKQIITKINKLKKNYERQKKKEDKYADLTEEELLTIPKQKTIIEK